MLMSILLHIRLTIRNYNGYYYSRLYFKHFYLDVKSRASIATYFVYIFVNETLKTLYKIYLSKPDKESKWICILSVHFAK